MPDSTDNDTVYFDQYKLMVNSSLKISDQRIRMNEFYLTFNTLILSIIFSLIEFKVIPIDSCLVFLIILTLTFTNLIWALNLKYFRNLNSAKFQVINKMENKLPVKIFSEEWDILKKKNHKSLSTIEQLIPIILFHFLLGISIYISGLLHIAFLIVYCCFIILIAIGYWLYQKFIKKK